MLKHIGRHNNEKVVVIFRKVPEEGHMCLVAYSDRIPSGYHDDLMSALESPEGQQAENFADVLHRKVARDGRNLLTALHNESYIKKVPTAHVILTPTTKSQARLDEINDIVDQIASGEEAQKRLAELDANAGMDRRKPVEFEKPQEVVETVVESTEVLDDTALAKRFVEQAREFEAEARRLRKEAYELDPSLKTETTKKPAAKKTTTTKKASTRARKTESA